MTIIETVKSHDWPTVVALVIAGTSNGVNALSDIHISDYLAIGSFIIAVIIAITRSRVYWYDGRLKKLEYKQALKDLRVKEAAEKAITALKKVAEKDNKDV